MGAAFIQIKKMLEKFDATQKLTIAAVMILVVGSIIALVTVTNRTDYAILYAQLDNKDASEIMSRLDSMGVDYKVEGSSVYVPKSDADTLKMQLAGEGLPSGGMVGYEIFDGSSFGANEFTQQVNYKRALEGELSRTISSMDQVSSAVVRVAIPEEKLYLDSQKDATASVLLKVAEGSLGRPQISGIVHLVSSSVEGLMPENVTVIDQMGNVLSEAGQEVGMATGSQIEAQRAYEGAVRSKIQNLVDQVLGPGKAVAQVTADLDFTTSTAQLETYDVPEGMEGAGLPSSEHTMTESYEGAGAGMGGIPGTDGNIPDHAAGIVGGGPATYTKDENVTNYLNNRVIEERVTPPGALNRMSVAVLIDDDIAANQIFALEEAIGTAVGIDFERGDQISIQPVTFDRAVIEEELAKAQAAENRRMLLDYAKQAIVIIFLAVVFFILWKKWKKAKETIADLPPIFDPEMLKSAEGGDAALKARELIEGGKRMPMLEPIEIFASQKPDEVANLIRYIMRENG